MKVYENPLEGNFDYGRNNYKNRRFSSAGHFVFFLQKAGRREGPRRFREAEREAKNMILKNAGSVKLT